MKYGVDSAYPSPNPRSLVGLGWQFACGYIGGRAENVWTPEDWKRHSVAGLQLGPIWVSPTGAPSESQGTGDGNRALTAMQDNHLSGVVLIDVENGAIPVDWVRGFMASLHAGSCAGYLYGSHPTLEAIGGIVDAWWLAEWVQSGTRLGRAPIDWSMWQYATGPQFDYNVAVDGLQLATYNG